MAIPDFQTIMLPLLQSAGDSKDHTLRDTIEHLAKRFSLSGDEQKELLPSRTQARFDNRVYWAKAYLKMAGLLENPPRGPFRITDEGKKVLALKPTEINIKFLMKFEKFSESRKKSSGGHDAETTPPEAEGQKTPRELLEENHQKLSFELAANLIETLKKASPGYFEKVVLDLLLKMGYGGWRDGAGRVVGGPGDQGIDAVINQDRLGLDVIYIQAKRWDAAINDEKIRNFVGSLAGHKAGRGVFITTSSFTQKAIDFVEKIPQKVILIDGNRLSQLMIEHGIGVSTVSTFEIKKVDTDYFAEE